MKLISVVLALLLVLAVLALYLPPELWWGLSLISAISPILLILNFLIFMYWIWRPSWWIISTVVALVLSMGILADTVSVSSKKSPAKDCVQVLSYNVSNFGKPRGYNFVKDSLKLSSIAQTRSFVNWVVENPAPVKCFQEFYTFSDNPIFDVDSKLKQGGWQYSFISADTLRVNKSRFGVAIYSKYPMLDKGIIFIGTSSRFNRGIWADLAVGEDTIRVVNVHFQSAQLQRAKRKSSGKTDAARRMFWMYRASLRERNTQLRSVLALLEETPYPVILSGDLNSTPYSHVYQLMNDELANGFEEEGRGFGFTFNHPKLFFLRIDHQFVSQQLETCAFSTRQDITYSAHHPLEGWYRQKD